VQNGDQVVPIDWLVLVIRCAQRVAQVLDSHDVEQNDGAIGYPQRYLTERMDIALRAAIVDMLQENLPRWLPRGACGVAVPAGLLAAEL
jgi:hypothetical protein